MKTISIIIVVTMIVLFILAIILSFMVKLTKEFDYRTKDQKIWSMWGVWLQLEMYAAVTWAYIEEMPFWLYLGPFVILQTWIAISFILSRAFLKKLEDQRGWYHFYDAALGMACILLLISGIVIYVIHTI